MTNTTSASVPSVSSEQAPVASGTQEMYAIFCGDINLLNMHILTRGLTTAMGMNVSRLHLLFHTWGGIAGDGVYLYNLLRKLPLEVILYNTGQVASAGAIAYLGAKSRKTTANGIFMIHRAHNSPQGANASKLKSASDSLELDDARTEAILRDHIKLPDELWKQLEYHDVWISGTDAVKYGLADEIAEFSPPAGTKVLNALG
jgi:ATP-dependent Clp protease protease subunit